MGNWMSYGKSTANGKTAQSATHSGWAETNAGDPYVLSSTATVGDDFGITTDLLYFYPHLGEGYYKYDCVATYQTTATGSTQIVNAQGVYSEVIVALEMCDDGSSPTPAQPGVGVCSDGGSGGSGIADDVSDFWDYLVDAVLALAVLVLIIAGAAVLYFTGREQQAIGVAIIGIGVTLALFVSNIEVEESTADILGTIAHVGLLAGTLVALMGMFSERTQFTVNAIVYGGFGFWFVIHTMSLMGSDDMMDWVADSFMADLIVPAIPIVALIAAIATVGLFVLNLVLAFNFVDEDSVWGEVATLGSGE